MPCYHEFFKYGGFMQKVVTAKAAFGILRVQVARIQPCMNKDKIFTFNDVRQSGKPCK